MAFFWLLRSGEYCSSIENHPFRLGDVQLFIGNDRLDPLICDLGQRSLRHSHVHFTSVGALDPRHQLGTTLTDGVRGEIIGRTRSRHLYASP
jgi:hypothetical protein